MGTYRAAAGLRRAGWDGRAGGVAGEVLLRSLRLRAWERDSSGVCALAQLLVDHESVPFVVREEQFRYLWIA